MGKLSLTLATILVLLSFQSVNSSELTFEFGSPSFSGNGKSSHYLTIENIEKTRKDAIKAAEKAAKEKDGVYNMTCDKVNAKVRVLENGEWEILEITGRHEQAYERKKVYE